MTLGGVFSACRPTHTHAPVWTLPLYSCVNIHCGPAVRDLQCGPARASVNAPWFTSDLKSKQDKVKTTNLKKLPKIKILPETLHATQLLKLLDKMYKYEKDPIRTVGATEWTQECETDRQTDGGMDGVKPIYPQTTLLKARTNFISCSTE